MVYHAIFTWLFFRNNPQWGHFQVIEWRLHKRGPEFDPHKFLYTVYGQQSLASAMLIAGSMKRGAMMCPLKM